MSANDDHTVDKAQKRAAAQSNCSGNERIANGFEGYRKYKCAKGERGPDRQIEFTGYHQDTHRQNNDSEFRPKTQ